MEQNFSLHRYLSEGVENLVRGALRASASNPRERVFLAKFALACKAAAKKRAQSAAQGEQIPPFLIASVTSQCNLHCAGCYARENNACADAAPVCQLTDAEWARIFEEARGLGVSFILLAGGEPLLRKGVLSAAGKLPDILFPVFTNGTMMDEDYIRLFDRHRNLLPVLSLEGGAAQTDARRGSGVYARLLDTMARLRESGVLFGVSLTVTTGNLREISADAFLEQLAAYGCRLAFFVEYVPAAAGSEALAPGDAERAYLQARLDAMRSRRNDLLLIAFPGDEKASGGCLAAGRGFFHINSHGGAEPCPFSPYTGASLRTASLREALQSPLFRSLRDGGLLLDEHTGGCVLFEKRALVEALQRQ